MVDEMRRASRRSALPESETNQPEIEPMRYRTLAALPALAIIACNGAAEMGNDATRSQAAQAPTGEPFQRTEIARFDEPWAMTFIPGTNRALITEKRGVLKLWEEGGAVIDVAGVPAVDYGGQGGLGDVVLHPDFANNGLVYLSYAEAGQGGRGAAVGRGRLVVEGDTAHLDSFEVVWRQVPKTDGRGHYGHRLAFSPDGRYLFVTNGDRQLFDPAQDNSQHLGTIVRLTADGATPPDNPFAGQGDVQAQIWTTGHRNPLGIAFDAAGNLWSHEMGPRHGDEFNLILRGRNYGYPIVSEGDHYDDRPIPNHSSRPEFEAPKISWVPAISPAGMMIYSGDMFPEWRGSAFLGGLSGQVLVRVAIEGTDARVGDTWDMGTRIREVEQAPDGAIYVLEDGGRDAQGRMWRLTR
jgi:aldose sugar dehydrogenase